MPAADANDTIAAVATAAGRGGVGIIRLSGPAATAIGRSICGRDLQPRHAHFCSFHDDRGAVLDTGIGLYFAAPHSFTGEDVVELQAHGGPVILDLLLRECLRLGARQARPGEYSERAYLNDKLDLAQAEAIADLINSTTESAARNASRSLQGAFSRRIDQLVQEVTRLRVYVEAAIDFPEEEIDFIADGQVRQQLDTIRDTLGAVLHEARQGTLLQEGMKLVIAGRPNAGKSSLLNALSGQDTAIVTAIEGTTRDVLREHIQLDGLPLHIIDTAGLHASDDPVEQAGMQRARGALAQADRVLLLVDDQAGFSAADDAILADLPAAIPHTVVYNKIDLTGRRAGLLEDGQQTALAVSVQTGAGLEDLRAHLKQSIGYREDSAGSFSARRRHLDALARARMHVDAARRQLEAQAGELLAEELRQAQQALGEITGEVSSDDLLGRIFADFCIGK